MSITMTLIMILIMTLPPNELTYSGLSGIRIFMSLGQKQSEIKCVEESANNRRAYINDNGHNSPMFSRLNKLLPNMYPEF